LAHCGCKLKGFSIGNDGGEWGAGSHSLQDESGESCRLRYSFNESQSKFMLKLNGREWENVLGKFFSVLGVFLIEFCVSRH